MRRILFAAIAVFMIAGYVVDAQASDILSALGLKGKVKKLTIMVDDDGYSFNFTPEGKYIGEINYIDGANRIESYDSEGRGVIINYRSGHMTEFEYDGRFWFFAPIIFTEYNSHNLPIKGYTDYEGKEYITIKWDDMDSHGNYQIMNIKNVTNPNNENCLGGDYKWKIEYWPE